MRQTEHRRMMALLPDGVPRYVRCYDDGGSADRYTVVFTGRYRDKTGGEFWYLGMSGAPFHPQGFGQHGSHDKQIDSMNGRPPAVGRRCRLGTRITFQQLPADCQTAALRAYCDLWDLWEAAS